MSSELQVTVGIGEVVATIASLVGSYILWSAKKLLAAFEQNVAKLTERCEEQEARLDKHERCLTKICINHKHNHNQEVDCGF